MDVLCRPNIEMEAFDIDPKKDYITKQNFLELGLDKYKSYQSEGRKIHCIRNPPFGRQASLARKFIKKCSLFSNTIAFILPKSFRKESYQKAFPLEFHLIKEYDRTGLPRWVVAVSRSFTTVPTRYLFTPSGSRFHVIGPMLG